MKALAILAGKEIRAGLRNRWVIATTLLLALLALALAFLGSAPTGVVTADALSVTIVSLSSLSMYLVPLLALLLSYDAIVGEAADGTLALLLAYPVARWQVVLGKFLGHLALLGFAITVGYGLAALAISLVHSAPLLADWRDFAVLIGSSILLGGAFVALGYLLSVAVKERATAAGLAVVAWLAFVLLYDLLLLGALVADGEHRISAALFPYLLLLNPADSYRLINLSGLNGAGMFAGMAGLSARIGLSPVVPLAALAAWIAAPLALAGAIFARKEV